MKKICSVFILLCLFPLGIFSQEIITASEFFDLVSENYRQIEDYQAKIEINQENSIMSGTIFHRRPNLLLIEFEDPEEQVIVVDGETLVIYIPYLNVVMEQHLDPLQQEEEEAGAFALATGQGLDLMKERYSVAYLDSQDAVPLDEDSQEMVRKLKLEWQTIDEGFRQLTVSVDEDLFIRRIAGITSGFEEIQLDFTEMVVNQNLPEGRFRYIIPPSANIISNFIFEPEE